MSISDNSMNRVTKNLDKMHFEVSQAVYAAMETGNFEQASLVMEEYKDKFPEEAQALGLALVRDYGRGV